MSTVSALNCYDAPSIFGGYFRFWCVPYQTFSEIHRISKKDLQLNPQLSMYCKLLKDTLMLLRNILGTAELVVNHSRRFIESSRSVDTLCTVSWRTANPEKRKTGEPWTQLLILLEDSTNL
jgi:hypothetical protein